MKKNLFLILVIAGLIWGFSTPEPTKKTLLSIFTPYNIVPEHLNGQVKSVKERSYWAVDNNGTIEKGKLVTTEEKRELRYALDFDAHFDKNGDVVQCKYILDDGKFNAWDIEYLDGKIVKATFTRDDTIRTSQKFEYLSNGLKIFTYKVPENELLRTTNSENNEQGFVKKLEWSNAENELLGYILFDLNELNRVTGYKRYNGTDSLLSYTEYTYDDRGFANSTKLYDTNGNIDWDGAYENLSFDEYGNWTTSTAINDGKLTLFCEREYEYY